MTGSDDAPVQWCIRHKERNVTDHLPERDRPALRRRLRPAWDLDDHQGALAAELEHVYPDAAKGLSEGMDETLTMQCLRVRGALKRTLSSTNPIESMIEIVRKTQRNVKRWQTGDMALEVDRRRDAPSRTTVPQDHRLQRPRRPRAAYRPRTRRTQPNTGGSYEVVP